MIFGFSFHIRHTISESVSTKMTFVFDIESTGLPKSRDFRKLTDFDSARIVSIAWYIVEDDAITSFLIYPDGFDIPYASQSIHGITTKEAIEDGLFISDMFDSLKKALKHVDTIISYNINFDINVLKSECYRYDRLDLIAEIDSKQQVCCMLKAQDYLGVNRFPKLAITYEKLFNEPLESAHNATADTINCWKCYKRMIASD